MRCVVWLLLAASLAACRADQPQPGVVAQVDGRPITLERVERSHDVRFLHRGEDAAPSVERLQDEYGRVLGDIIVQELVADELERRGLAVSAQELQAEENDLRADYPPGVFDQLLAEEYLDLDFWRAQLKTRLEWQRFVDGVLRPQVLLDAAELEAYYREHRQEFVLPPRVELTLWHAQTREALESARDRLPAAAPPGAVAGEVSSQQLLLEAERVPASWLDALQGLDPGQPSPILRDETGYLLLVLNKRLPAKDMDKHQALAEIEDRLLGPRLRASFDAWLANRLVTATIQVNPQLLGSLDRQHAPSANNGSNQGSAEHKPEPTTPAE